MLISGGSSQPTSDAGSVKNEFFLARCCSFGDCCFVWCLVLSCYSTLVNCISFYGCVLNSSCKLKAVFKLILTWIYLSYPCKQQSPQCLLGLGYKDFFTVLGVSVLILTHFSDDVFCYKANTSTNFYSWYSELLQMTDCLERHRDTRKKSQETHLFKLWRSQGFNWSFQAFSIDSISNSLYLTCLRCFRSFSLLSFFRLLFSIIFILSCFNLSLLDWKQ